MCLRGVERKHEVEKSGVAMRIKEIGKNASDRKNVKTSERCVAFSDLGSKWGALTNKPNEIHIIIIIIKNNHRS